jgi:hypothetical protein
MKVVISILLVAGLPLLGPPLAASGYAQSEPISVDPAELDRREDLIGKVVSVDDRVRFYLTHRGQGYDELYLKQTSVIFRLPPRCDQTAHACYYRLWFKAGWFGNGDNSSAKLPP